MTFIEAPKIRLVSRFETRASHWRLNGGKSST